MDALMISAPECTHTKAAWSRNISSHCDRKSNSLPLPHSIASCHCETLTNLIQHSSTVGQHTAIITSALEEYTQGTVPG